MADKNSLTSKKTMIFISGAGQGFGRACALSAAKMFTSECLMLLCGRHIKSLNETSDMIRDLNPSAVVKTFEIDLLKVNEDDVYKTLQQLLIIEKYQFESFVIIHNAANIGDITRFSDEYSNIDYLSSFFQVNLIGTIALNSVLLRRVKEISGENNPSIFIVNVSSLAAITPFPSMSLYCTAKAAREMFFNCLSLEWSTRHSQPLWIINYAPGSMDTDMLRELNRDSAADSMKTYVNKLYVTGDVIDPMYSSDKLFYEVLNRHETIESGSRIDIFDLK